MINIEVERGANENSVSLLRRFTKRVQGAGVLPRVRSIRYASRNISEAVKRKKTLKVLKRREEINKLMKLGKIVDNGRGKK
jgi:ribosomal protein S21